MLDSLVLLFFVVDEVGVTVRPDNGYDALASVDINPVLESKVVNVTSNGTTSVVPSDGFCGIGDISLNVNVPTSQYTYRMESVTIDVGNGTPVSFPMRKFNTRVYSYDSQYFINASTSNTQFNVVVFGSYIGGYDFGTRENLNNLSYLCYANVSTNGPNFVYADRLSYKPELYFVSTVYLDVLYPSLTVSDRLAKVKSVTFNFKEYILPYTSTGKTVSHTVYMTNNFYPKNLQYGDIKCSSNFGLLYGMS